MTSVDATSPAKRKRDDENDPSLALAKDQGSAGLKAPPSRIPRLSSAHAPPAAKKGRVSTMGTDTLRTPLANRTNADLKTPRVKAPTASALKTPQTRSSSRASAGPQSAISARMKAPVATASRSSLRPAPAQKQAASRTAETPQTKGDVAAFPKETLSAPAYLLLFCRPPWLHPDHVPVRACGNRPVSDLFEQAGIDERIKALEEEFARKNKEAEELWKSTSSPVSAHVPPRSRWSNLDVQRKPRN